MKGLLILLLAGSALAADKVYPDEPPFRARDLNVTGCYLESHVRGVGVPLSHCRAGFERNGLLCYPKCRTGYYGVGPVCWQSCPDTHIDTGAFCQAMLPWGDNNGCPWYDKCGLTFAQGCVKCPRGYGTAGCICASGVTFAKASYGRTAGEPMICAPGLQADAGLCYRPCVDHYNGVGPVCWAGCPPKFRNQCGAVCLKEADGCKEVVKEDASAVVTLTFDIAECILTGGAKCNLGDLRANSERLINGLAFPVCHKV